METTLSYLDNTAFFSSDERRWINRIHKLKEQFPDQVEILCEPETNDGCIYCKIPAAWMKLTPPRALFMTEEQRAEIGARLNAARTNAQA